MNKQLELWVISQRIPQVPRQIVISLELSSLLFSDQDYLPSCTSPGIQQLNICSVYKECGQTDKQGDSYIPPQNALFAGGKGD